MRELLKTHFDVLYTIIQVWIDGFTILLACFVGFYAYNSMLDPNAQADLGDYRQLFVLITGIVLCCCWLMGLYSSQKSILNVEEYRSIYKVVLVSFLITSSLLYLLRSKGVIPNDNAFYKTLSTLYDSLPIDQNNENLSRIVHLFILGFTYILLSLERALMFGLLKKLHKKGYGNLKIAIFGTSEVALRLYKKLELFPALGLNIVGFIRTPFSREDDPVLPGSSKNSNPMDLGELDDFLAGPKSNIVSRVLIACPEIKDSDLLRLCRRLESLDIEYRVLPVLYHFMANRFNVENFDNMPLIAPSYTGGRPIYEFFKRSVDIFVASLGLLCAAILWPFIALAIKLDSKGPILFTQLRKGVNNTTFRMIKFRTMYSDQCGDAVTPKGADARVTFVGRILRKTSLDELPQLMNVLRGEMTLIGPRPEMPFIVDEYEDYQRRRLDARPGITGLWQVSDKRKLPIHEYIDYDLYYIQNRSVFLDLTIAVLTFTTMFNFSSTD
jgi:putative colanic acid biosynthesis UDP-glucose lipid carrier transferase